MAFAREYFDSVPQTMRPGKPDITIGSTTFVGFELSSHTRNPS